MVRPRTSTSVRLWAAAAAAAGLCAGLCGSFAGAVVVAAARRDIEPPRPNGTEPEASQSLVDQVDGPAPSDGYARFGDHRTSGKDYGGYADDGRHAPGRNAYGPPRDYYYYDEPPPSEHYRPHQAGGHRPSGGVYHHHENYYAADGEVRPHYHRPGELNVQPLLWPLAGIALLGVLSALVKTPLLLHLGRVGGGGRRRRRRNADVRARAAEETTTLSDKLNDKRGPRRRFDPRACSVCDMVAASSVYDRRPVACVERSVCEVMSRNEPGGADTDKRLLTATIARLVGENDEIADDFRKRLESAAWNGRIGGDCGTLYPCAGTVRSR